MPYGAAEIKSYLQSKGSPLASYSNDFVQVGQKYGIDPRFLVAVSGAETGFAKAGSRLANPFGYMSAKRFSGPREVMERMGRELTKRGGYYDGKRTIRSIGATWAPPNAANDAGGNAGWPSAVGQFYKEMGGNPNSPVIGNAVALAGAATRAVNGSQPPAPKSQNATFDLNTSIISGAVNRQKGQSLTRSVGRSVQQGLLASALAGEVAGTKAEPANSPSVLDDALAGTGAVKAINAAKQYIGTPYSWGGGSPSGPTYGIERGANTKGFDCSSLVQMAWARAGVKIPRVTYDQMKIGKAVPNISQAKPGDLLFPSSGHVQMYLGNGKVIEAPQTGGHVQIVPLRSSYTAIRRPAG